MQTLRPLAGLPRRYWALWLGVLINMMGGVVESLLAVFLVQVRGLDLSMAGLAVAVMGGCAALSQLAGGALADRLGRKPTMLISSVSQFLALLCLANAPSQAAILISVVAVGLTREMYRPAINAMVADVVPDAMQQRAFSLIYWAVNLGWAFALVAGGWAAETSFFWIFWMDAGSCALFAIIASFLRESGSKGGRETVGSGLAVALRDRVLLWYAGTVAFYTTVTLLGMTTLPLAMSRLGLATGAIGTVLAVNGIAAIVLLPLSTRLTDRASPASVLCLSSVVVGIGYALTNYAQTPIQFALTVLVWTTGEVIGAGAIVAVVAVLAPRTLRGIYNGVYGVAWSVGLMASPIFGTVLLARSSTALWSGALLLALAVAVSFRAMRASIDRRQATSRASPNPDPA